MAAAPVNVTVRNISTRPDAVFDVQSDITIAEKGRVDVMGTVAAQPPAADLTLKLASLPLPVIQPYLNPMMKVHLVSGTLGGDGTLQVRVAAGQPDIHFKGSLESHGFLTRDRIDNERFLAWKGLAVKQINFTPRRLSVGSVRFTEPYAKLLVHKNRTTNVQEILGLPMDSTQIAAQTPPPHAKPKKKKKGTPASAPAPPTHMAAAAPVYPVRVGKLELVGGSADFGDLSLILPFAARVEKLNGSVSGLSSDSLTRAEVALDGQIAPSGTAQVRQINPADHPFVDLNVVFHSINMPVLTPYCGQFMGREVDGEDVARSDPTQLRKHPGGSDKVVLDSSAGQEGGEPEALICRWGSRSRSLGWRRPSTSTCRWKATSTTRASGWAR